MTNYVVKQLLYLYFKGSYLSSWSYIVKIMGHTFSNTWGWNDCVENYRTSIKKMKKLYLYLLLYIFLVISTKYKFDETKRKNRKLISLYVNQVALHRRPDIYKTFNF